MTPSNINNLEAKRLRKRAKDMLDLKGLAWSNQKIAGALGISRNMVTKTLFNVGVAKPDSLYWKLSTCDGNHAVSTPCYDLECWLEDENPLFKGVGK